MLWCLGLTPLHLYNNWWCSLSCIKSNKTIKRFRKQCAKPNPPSPNTYVVVREWMVILHSYGNCCKFGMGNGWCNFTKLLKLSWTWLAYAIYLRVSYIIYSPGVIMLLLSSTYAVVLHAFHRHEPFFGKVLFIQPMVLLFAWFIFYWKDQSHIICVCYFC